jgi:hypothetical protein
MQSSCGESVASSIIKDKKWEHLPAPFKEVKLDRMDGRNLLSKVLVYLQQ